MTARACSLCTHWRRLSVYRGQCRQAEFVSTTYRLVGASDATLIFEETKPDYWCTLFAPLEPP